LYWDHLLGAEDGLVDRFDGQVKRDSIEYIEASYNPRHRHSTLGHVNPPISSVASLPRWSWTRSSRVTHSIATMNEPLGSPGSDFLFAAIAQSAARTLRRRPQYKPLLACLKQAARSTGLARNRAFE